MKYGKSIACCDRFGRCLADVSQKGQGVASFSLEKREK